MVSFASYFALLLTVASSATAVPSTLKKRQVTCRDDLPASSLANIREAVDYINYLTSLNQPYIATISSQSSCRWGNTQITGLTHGGNTATSSCKDVTRGAGFIIDKCSRGDGKVRGANEA
ncbi:hypothetical protein FACUT_7951 [Fusarium acutatum]|uniref:Uncharacterized protein n=1 Tax=Fusarium acutatum TaxID=78861 RepID=A0A8H4NPW6_9HYPO|nr:hypothetical protein FACUT_7951 [Fusarium acutatum]